ncbi:MAG: DUF4124 domain-containing protein [Gammaproteobacteria bacterium]|jgi:hypothetical protein
MRHILLLALLLCCAAAQATEIYRWVDASGQVHYGQVPPPGQRAERMPAHGAGVADEDGAQRLQSYAEQLQAARERKAAEQGQAAETRQQAQARCEQARAELEKLEQRPPSRIRIEDAQGGITRMTEAEHERRKTQAQQTIAEHCTAPAP